MVDIRKNANHFVLWVLSECWFISHVKFSYLPLFKMLCRRIVTKQIWKTRFKPHKNKPERLVN